jgi:hypothetical protein
VKSDGRCAAPAQTDGSGRDPDAHSSGAVRHWLRDLNGRLFQHIQDAREFAVHADQFGNQLADVIQLALQVHVFAIRQQVERILAG